MNEVAFQGGKPGDKGSKTPIEKEWNLKDVLGEATIAESQAEEPKDKLSDDS